MDSKTDKQGTGREKWSAEVDRKRERRVHGWTDRWEHWDRQGTRMNREGTWTRMGQQTEVALSWAGQVH